MFRPLSLYVGLRYTRAKRRNHFISFISLTSMLGIALGVTALITVLSVMNGFEHELRTRILGMTAHATISGYGEPLRDWPQVAERAQDDPRVLGAAPFIQKEGMLVAGSRVNGSLVRGIDPNEESAVSDVGQKMVQGRLEALQAGEFNIVLGMDLARILGVRVGDKVTLVTPAANVTPAGMVPRLKRFTVSGLFQVGMYEYDSALALVHIDDAAILFRMPGEVSGVQLKLDDMFRAPWVVRELAGSLPGTYRVSDWTQQHANFFRAIRTEKTVMFVILSLIVAVAAFNIVSTLVMVVTDKKADIAILRTLGASPGAVARIFVVQGSLIGFMGTLAGVALGTLVAFNVDVIVPFIENLFNVEFLPQQIYFISSLPSDPRWSDIGIIAATALILALAATLYPSWRASRLQPAEVLRHD